VAVRRVVDDGDAVAGFCEVHPAVAGDLEAGRLPGGVGVGGALDVAELDLGGRVRGADVDREGRLEDLLGLVPVDVRLEVDPGTAGADGDRLGDRGALAEGPLDTDRADQRVLLDDRDGRDVQEVGVAVLVVLVDVPGVPVVGQVGVQTEQVARLGQDLAAGAQVADGGQGAVLGHLHSDEPVVEDPAVHRHGLRGRGVGERRGAARGHLYIHR
jgi:hypothetical protein